MTPPDLLALVERSVVRFPRHIALEVGSAAMTYEELWRAAGELAHVIGSVRRLGLCTTKSRTAYVGYLAALRVGATVVPMNPAFPRERNEAVVTAGALDSVLVDSGADPSLTAALGAAGCRLVIDDGRECAVTGAPPEVAAPDIAYILFTSGSTGRPKGVPISHRNVVAYVEHVRDRYEIGPGCRLSQTFDLTFDPSVFDLFAAWGSGATVVAAGPADLLMPTTYVRRRGITHWFSVPSAISVAQQHRQLSAGVIPDLRYSIFIGEQLTRQQALAWHQAAPNSAIENVYGPTELTVSCTEYRLPRDPVAWPVTSNGTVPIGEVYPHLEWVILDEEGRVAAEGELCVRGIQRFAGYLDESDNAGRFFDVDGDDRVREWRAAGQVPPEYWYRTGDRVRREAAGLVHLGRLDRQVKVRGYRIELGEIEMALRACPTVLDAVVLVRDTQLHAFYTGERCDRPVFRKLLGSRLPGYMIPGSFTHLDRLPLNDNGKIDHRALAERAAMSTSDGTR